MICVAASAFAGEYTIVFKDNGVGKGDNTAAFSTSKDISTLVTEGAEYLSSIKATNNSYHGKDGYGLKFSSSSKNGVLELNLDPNGVKKITKIVATAAKFGSDASALSINDADAYDLTSTELADYTFNFAPTEANTTIKIAATKRLYVTKLVVTYAEDGEVVVPAPSIKMAAENFVEISAEEGATIYYTLDGTEPTATEGTPYMDAIKINTACTVKAIAEKDGATSAVTSFDAYLNYVSSVAELITLNDATHTITLGTPLTVAYQNGAYTYVKDEDSFFLLYDKNNIVPTGLTNGKVLASATGTYKLQNGAQPELLPTAVGELTDGEAVEAATLSIADILAYTGNDALQLINYFVRLEGVTITDDSSANNYWLGQDGNEIKCYNQYTNSTYYDVLTMPTETEGKTYNVVGFIGYYGGNLQINPISVTEVVPVAKYAVTFEAAENGSFTVMNGETQLTSGDEVEENTELTINATPADGYELGAITVNGTALQGNTFTLTEAATIAVTFNKVVPPAPEYTAPSGTPYADNYLTAITSTGAQENIEYTASSNPGIYNVLESAIAVVPGTEFNINFVANCISTNTTSAHEDIRYCQAYIFTDWYGTGEFTLINTIGDHSPAANIIANYNTVMNINQAFTMPEDVEVGKVARIRVVYQNAWTNLGSTSTPNPNASNLDKGIAYDIVVNAVAIPAPTTYTLTVVANGVDYFLANADTYDFFQSENDVYTIADGTELMLGINELPEGKVLTAVKLNEEELIGMENMYNFTMTEDATLEFVVEDAPVTEYTITFTGEHGKMQYQGILSMEDIPAEGVKMEAGYNVFVKVVPDEGYVLESITLNGTDVTGEFTDNEYTIQTISSDCAFAAVFTEESHGVEYTAPEGETYADNYLTAIKSSYATEDINYSADSHPGNLYNVLDQAISAAPGREFNINFVANSLGEGSQTVVREDIRFTAAYIFADWYGTGEFTLVQKIGKTAPTHNVYGNYDEVMNINQAFTMPEDVEFGTTARIRIVYQNAWLGLGGASTSTTPNPNATNLEKGIAYDIVVNAVEDNTVRITLINPIGDGADVAEQNVRGVLTDRNMDQFELDENNSLRVDRGTRVYLLIYNGQPMANGDSYQFGTCTINDEQINPTFAGMFYLYGFEANEDKVITITQDLLNSINGIAAENNGELSFANGIVTVPADAELSIVALNGQVLRTAKGSINVSDLNNGIYLAVAKIDGKVYTLKFMK